MKREARMKLLEIEQNFLFFPTKKTNEANIGNRWEVSLNFVSKRLRGEFYRIFKGFARIVHEVAFVARTDFCFSQIFPCV